MIKKLFVLIFLSLSFLLFVPSVIAGRGCCSWHGGQSYCDTSTCRWVCNDGTYSPSCMCCNQPPPPRWTPTPTLAPINMQATLNHTFDYSTCTYTIQASWDKPVNYDRYSVSAVKTSSKACLDPGPIVDTGNTNWSFSKLSSGIYMINIKPANQSQWENYYHCWQYILPKITPSLSINTIVEDTKQYITYQVSCASSITGNNGLGYLNNKTGKILVNPKELTEYTITAKSIDGETTIQSITLTPITPSPTPAPTNTPTPTPTPFQIKFPSIKTWKIFNAFPIFNNLFK
jgi:hypothetical protein